MRISPAVTAAGTLGALLLTALPGPTLAQAGGWGGPGWGGPGWGGRYGGYGDYGGSLLDSRARSSNRGDPREGRVQVSRFIAADASADALGHGAVAVTSLAAPNREGAMGDGPRNGGPLGDGPLDGAQDYLAHNARAPFEAAVEDRLIAVGYDTIHADPTGGQLAEVRVSREVLVPAEVKRSPVSGTAAMEVGSRGSAYGLGVNVDMTKPRTALLSTRLDARIKDRATGKVLWEGHSQIATREGDDKWNDGAIASRLAEALFDDFRHPTG
jgi:hypothetical protein